MRLEIYNEPVEDEKVVRIRLVQGDAIGELVLVACDSNGTRLSQGEIASISQRGIHRRSAFGKDIGFKMDNHKIRDY